jgi:general secretion pathway protein K
VPAGNFDIAVTTDDGRINMTCAGGSVNSQGQIEKMLTAMVAPPAYERMFQERDGDGQFTDRATFVRALIDWVDRDSAGYGASGQPEDYGYESRRDDAYKARDNYPDSLDELRLVRGMDERRWGLFGNALTIYGGCKVNVNAANDLNVIRAIIALSAKDSNDPVLRDVTKLWRLAAVVAQARGLGLPFKNVDEFAEFVKDPAAALGDLMNPASSVAEGNKPGGTNPTPNLQIQGVELDPVKLKQVARTGGRRTYRVTATATMGKIEKKIVGVWDNDTTNQNFRDPAYSRGAWVYWREE